MKKAILVEVTTKARVHFGKEYPASKTEYSCEIVPNESIAIFKNGILANTFKLGDQAEYDSYNLNYYGEIVSISAKAVGIVAYKGTGCEKRKLLDLNTFCWRNYDFDLGETMQKNSDTMMYI